MDAELQFPVVAHHRIIVDAAKRNDETAKGLFASFDLVEPFGVGRTSAGGKYVSYALSVRLKDGAEMARLDDAIRAVPGVKMCL